MRRFYDVWTRLPYFNNGMIGSGVYALSEAGRQRFDRFPDLTADDAFVRLHFKPGERVTVPTCSFTVTPPTSLEKIIDIKTRSHFGNAELKRARPDLWDNEDADHGSGLRRLARDPRLWPALGVYGYVKVASRLRAKWRDRFGDPKHWERDDSSRQPTPTPS